MIVRQITAADWQAFRDFHLELKRQAPGVPHMYGGMLESGDPQSAATYKSIFSIPGRNPAIMFGLFEGAKMIGHSSLELVQTPERKHASFAGSEVAVDQRGQRLVDKFYQARMQYLVDHGFDGDITAEIRPTNLSSIKAAERNGFRNSGRFTKEGAGGYCIFTIDNPNTALIDAPRQDGSASRSADIDVIFVRQRQIIDAANPLETEGSAVQEKTGNNQPSMKQRAPAIKHAP